MRGRPVVFGEVLFDRFEDGNAVLGGAPFNVAWHLQGFGLAPLFISRIGEDDLGQRVEQSMSGWKMDTSGLQRDSRRPTGAVLVTVRDGQPGFDITPDQAYDFIDPGPCLETLRGVEGSLLYHGTLVARSGTSREALRQLRAESSLPTFVDINLRSPWWDHPLVWQALRGARWAKLNDDEIRRVNEDDRLAESPVEEIAVALRERFDFELLIGTLGAEGAFFVDTDGVHRGAAGQVEEVVDTVGAGDAFSSVIIYGLMSNWPRHVLLGRALKFAAAICGIQGATTTDRDLYQRYLREWNQ